LKIDKVSTALNTLQIQPDPKSKKVLWIIIGIIVSAVVVIGALIFWYVRNNGSFSTYPYIPIPKNSLRSSSFSELFSNLLMDTNETAVEYSVFSRSNLNTGS